MRLRSDRGSLTLTVSDALHSFKVNYRVRTADFTRYQRFQRQYSIVSLGFVLRLNTNHSQDEELEFESSSLQR